MVNIEINGKKIEAQMVVIKAKAPLQLDKEGKEEIALDADGRKLIKIRNPKANGEKPYIYTYSDGTPYTGTTYKSYKGKPISGFKKTAQLLESKSKKVELVTVLTQMISNEHTYYLNSKELKEELKNLKGQAVVYTPYTTSGLTGAYKACIYYDPNLDRVIMRLAKGNLDAKDMPESDNAKEVEVGIVQKVSMDDLEV